MKTSTAPSAAGRARLAMIVSASVFGTLGPFVRRIEVTSAELALYRAVLAAVFILLFFLIRRERPRLREIRGALWLLLLSGAAMGFDWMLLFEAYKYTTISLATLSYYVAPVIVTALCPLLFHERMTRTQLLCFLMSTLGVALIIVVIGNSLGGPTGYAINPARDLGPRIAHAILPIKGKGGSDWGYSWVPVVGPIIGAVVGTVIYFLALH